MFLFCNTKNFAIPSDRRTGMWIGGYWESVLFCKHYVVFTERQGHVLS